VACFGSKLLADEGIIRQLLCPFLPEYQAAVFHPGGLIDTVTATIGLRG